MKNTSFRATTAYVLGKEGAKLIGGNMMSESATNLVAEFLVSRDLNPSIKRPVYHVSLALPPDESLDDEQLQDLTKAYMDGMGFDPFEHQYFVARHSDRDHEHVHIVASRINLISGKVSDDSFDCYRSQQVIRELEKQFNLTPVASSWEVGKRAETMEQSRVSTRDQTESVRAKLQELLDTIIEQQPGLTVSDLIAELLEQGVSTHLNQRSNQIEMRDAKTALNQEDDGAKDEAKTEPAKRAKGISFAVNGVAIAGYKLGNRYSLPGLEQRGISYQPGRDNGATVRLKQQLDHADQSFPMLLKIWQIMQRMNTTLIDGKRYRFEVKRSKGNAQFVVHRKDEPVACLLSLTAPGIEARAIQDEEMRRAKFSLKDLRLTQEDVQNLSEVENKLSQWRQTMEAQPIPSKKQIVPIKGMLEI